MAKTLRELSDEILASAIEGAKLSPVLAEYDYEDFALAMGMPPPAGVSEAIYNQAMYDAWVKFTWEEWDYEPVQT